MKKKRRPELTIAPLIDCVFLLLLFFAVSTTLTKELGMPINKPKAKTSIPLSSDYFIITITDDKRLFLGKNEVSIEFLRKEIIETISKNPKTSVIISSDKKVSTGRLIEILDLCKEGGASSLSIATLPKLE
ncbi:MAG: biopolymer transporter ExbD [bacterium]